MTNSDPKYTLGFL